MEKFSAIRGILRLANSVVALSAVGWIAAVWLIVWLWGDNVAALDLEVFTLALLALPFMALTQVSGGSISGFGRVVLGQSAELVIQPTAFLLLIGAFYIFADLGFQTPAHAMFMQLIAWIIALGWGMFVVARLRPSRTVAPKSEFELRRWMSSALNLGAMAVITTVNLNASVLLLGLMAPADEVGIYRVVVQIASLVIFLVSALNAVLAPQITRLYHAGDLRRLQTLLLWSARTYTAAAVPVALILVIWPEQTIGLVFGAEYAAGADALAILCIGHVLGTAIGQPSHLLNMTDRERYTVRGLSAGAAVNICLSLLLIPPYGFMGAAIAASASTVFWKLLLSIVAQRSTGLSTHMLSVPEK